jgi:hypothetical protein
MSSLTDKAVSVGQEDVVLEKPKEHDSNSEGHDVDFSGIDEKKTLRKMDLRLIPALAVLYLLAFLDRGNIGNAKIQGLTKDLHLSANGYNIASTV